jgi:CheY-like chemotaxis protein
MSRTNGKVLVVDDELDTARTLGRILETSGFKVDILADPKAALGSFKTAYYDLAAIDVRMHAMNGFELCSEIKSKDNKIKVLFLTVLRDLHDSDDFKTDVSPKLHQRHFIQEPVNDDEFLNQVYCFLY